MYPLIQNQYNSFFEYISISLRNPALSQYHKMTSLFNLFSGQFTSRISCFSMPTKHVIDPSKDNVESVSVSTYETPNVVAATLCTGIAQSTYETPNVVAATLCTGIAQNQHKENNTHTTNNNDARIPQSNPIMSTQKSIDDVVYADTKIYIPNITSGKVVKVYDADTITVANRISVGGEQSEEIYRFQVRLNGIDSPEIKSKNPTTKALAKQSRDALSVMIFGKIVELRNVQLEKYGRLLADVYLGNLHLNQWLIDNKYAVQYDGGTKHIPEEWEA
jgi:endonuclease YncB( thermonuclease family)